MCATWAPMPRPTAGWSSTSTTSTRPFAGPFEWDLKRMAASLVLAGRAAGHKDNSARKAAAACVERYAAQMRAFARMPQLEVNRFQVHRIGLAKPVHAALARRSAPRRSTRWNN